jgi:hypothetical protein
MFATIAKFRAATVARAVSGPSAALAHANDNTKIDRDAMGLRRRGRPALACHWRLTTGGGLECCWELEYATGAVADDPDERCIGVYRSSGVPHAA